MANFDMTDLRQLCDNIINEQDFKNKSEKLDFALCHLDELRSRVNLLRDLFLQAQSSSDQ